MTDSDALAGTWETWPGFSKYEASHRGPIRNATTGRIMSDYLDRDGYRRLTLTGDDGKKHNVSRARCVLSAHAGPCPPGMETCHGPGGRQDDRYPENIRWDTKPENEQDKIRAGHAPKPEPTYECLNFAVCGNLVINEGRRCLTCMTEVGVGAAAKLNRGENLMDVAEHFGYTGPDWVYQLAVRFGGYEGTKREALTQHPSLSQRVTGRLVTLRARRRRVPW